MFFRILISVLFCFYFNRSFAFKSKEDSLLFELKKTKVDSLKFKIVDKLCTANIRKGNYDLAKSYNDSMVLYSERITAPKFRAIALASRATYYYKLGKYDSAIVYNNRSIEIAKEIRHYFLLIKCNINMGNIYNQRADYKKSVLYFQQAETYADLAKDTLGKISTTLNLGTVFYNINDYTLAKRNFLKAIKSAKELKSATAELASAYNNLATVFLNEEPQQLDSAMVYYYKFLQESTKIENQNNIALAYFNIAEVHRNKQETQKAEEFYFKSKALFEEMEDSVSIVKVFLGLSDNYMMQNKNADAIKVLKLGLEFCNSNEMQSYIADFYKNLAIAYYSIGTYKEAFEYYRKGTLISDSLYNAENSEILYDLQTKYESNEKEKQNLMLTSQNELSQKTIKQQRLVTYFIIGILVLSVFFGFFIFSSLKKQRNANAIISKQKEEVEQKNHIIEEKQKEILDSINYAKRIQYTLLAHHDFLKEHLPEHFIYFQPKDIVSGDFYWATKKDHFFYLAVCDSTGHGVPGAFMSLLNIGFLNEAINEKNIAEPNKIFNHVRERLVSSISKEGQQDGFDGILICINTITKEVTYATANNAPIIISDNKIVELKKDKMPVGIGDKMQDFNLYSISLNEGDTLYLYTDGYADQFGGDKGKKYKYKALHELLYTIHSKPINEQEEILKNNFENWRGNLEQVDDVCVVGIKF